MKLIAQTEGKETEIEIRANDSGVVSFALDGHVCEARVHQPEKDVLLFIIDGRVYECRLDVKEGDPSKLNITLGGRLYTVFIEDPKRLRGGRTSVGAFSAGSSSIVAPMPGKVVRVMAAIGDKVQMGDGIVTVEAMKMQNEMKATKAGTVKEVRIDAGATVNAGDVLVIIE